MGRRDHQDDAGVLQPLKSVETRDAILDLSDPGQPRPAQWPKAEFIVGNPPFLGGKKMRDELGNGTVEALFKAYEGRVPHEADLVAYWHEKAREAIEAKRTRRAGLLATQGIRGGANQQVLKRIKETGNIFYAWSDLEWVVDGATVHISIVAQDDGSEQERALDGAKVETIHADLSGGASSKADLTQAQRLIENGGLSFMGDTKGGAFDIPREEARKLVTAAPNPNGRPNTDVVKPWVNGLDVTRRSRDMFIIDFGPTMAKADAAFYELPFGHVEKHVQPERAKNNRAVYKERWWIHVEARPAMLKALAPLKRFIVTPTVAKHRLFCWERSPTLPDHQLIVIAREDDYAFGVLHSRVHETWALQKGTQLRVDPRYTPTTTFETFPFPWPLNTPESKLTRQQLDHHRAISDAARWLHEKRERWLNPPELVREVDDAPLPPRIEAVNADAAHELKRRTLTNLYNERPAWLAHLHEQLDHAVLDAYGLPHDIADDALLAALLELNLGREPAR